MLVQRTGIPRQLSQRRSTALRPMAAHSALSGCDTRCARGGRDAGAPRAGYGRKRSRVDRSLRRRGALRTSDSPPPRRRPAHAQTLPAPPGVGGRTETARRGARPTLPWTRPFPAPPGSAPAARTGSRAPRSGIAGMRTPRSRNSCAIPMAGGWLPPPSQVRNKKRDISATSWNAGPRVPPHRRGNCAGGEE